MKAYKGFDKDLKCRSFQYEVGKEYETDKAELCKCGFHACEMPLKVWDYYPPVDGNRYCEVEQSGYVKSEGADGKSVSTKLKVGAEIGIPGLVKAQIEWTWKQIENAKGEQGGDCANLAGGDRATLAGGYGATLAGGKSSICVGGHGGKAKGGLHSVLVLTDWEWVDKDYVPMAAKAIVIDGETYKPDTWYTLRDGDVVEVKDEEDNNG